MRSGAKICTLASAGFVLRVHVRPSGLGIQTEEYVLIHVRLALDELDRPGASFEEPQITIAGDVNQSLDRTSVALVVDEYGRRNLVIVPGIVRVILEVSLDGAGSDVKRDRRCGVEIVARALVADRRASTGGTGAGGGCCWPEAVS